MKRLWTIVGLLLLVFGLAAGSILLKQKTGFDLRKKADAVSGSQLLLKGPTEVKPGENFEVQVLIDTMPDNQYTISGADAVVSYSTSSNSDNPPPGCRYQEVQCFKAPCEKQLVCGDDFQLCDGWAKPGAQQKNEANGIIYFCSNGSWINPTQVNFRIQNLEKAEVTDQLKSSSPPLKPTLPILRLLSIIPGSLFDSYPNSYTIMTNPINISGIKNYAVDENGVFQGLRGGGIFATLTFVAPQSGDINIRLNYNGPEATDDSNINGFSVAGPVSIQKPVERLLTQPNELKIKVVSDVILPTPTPTPTPTPCAFYDSTSDKYYPCPSPTSFPIPTPLPQNSRTIKISTIFEGMQNRPLEMKLYAQTSRDIPPYYLGLAKTQPDGSAIFQVPEQYINAKYIWYIETPSHLRQYQSGRNLGIRSEHEIDFGMLIPGDIYADSLGQKDQVINTFDVSTSYSQWSVATDIAQDGRVASDLNGDGAVNNRDLAILLSNFGKSSRDNSRQTVVPSKKLIPVELPR